MIIVDKTELNRYYSEHRLWQGIPAIEITKRGRMFCAFYSGEVKETIGNFVVLLKSDDIEHFSEPITVLYKEGYRCFDPCLWIDPLGRLWFIWSVMPHHATYAAVCDNPDADELSWSEPFILGHDVMMNKPTVLSTGEWLFPIAVWEDKLQQMIISTNDEIKRESGAFVYRSIDIGKSFEKFGGTRAENRSFDEHMILEKKDGTLAMYIRTKYGIAVSYSSDGGKTWSESRDSGLGGPCSRFFIRRLKSGRILLINHYDFNGRNNLTALLSEDDGETWKYRYLLDERNYVSYPDAVETDDGYIHIVYDRERGGFKKSMSEVYECAREILYAKITEEDIISGKLSKGSKVKCVISKLGKYSREDENPFGEDL